MKSVLTLDYQASKQIQYIMAYRGDATLEYGDNAADISYFLIGKDNNNPDYKFQNSEEEHRIFNSYYNVNQLYAFFTLFDEIRLYPVSAETSYYDASFKLKGTDFSELGIKMLANSPNIPSKRILKETEKVFHLYQKSIVSSFMNDDSYKFLDGCPTDQIIDYYFEQRFYLDAYNKKVIARFLEKTKKAFDLNSDWLRFRNPWDSFETHLFNYFDKMFIGISDAISQSNGTLYSPIYSTPNLKKIRCADCQEINNYVLKADFSSGLNLIPSPESIEDIKALRKNADLISFRKVFSQWVEYLRDGDIQAFRNMRNDVINANKNLERLSKYKKIDESFFVRVLTCAGGFIPYVSEILGGCSFVTPFIVDNIYKKNRWCNLPAFHKEYRGFIPR